MDELTTKRLAVIKQLYNHGIDQSYEVEPMNGFSILSFHDCVEMFLGLCAERKGMKVDGNTKFGDYFAKMPNLKCGSTMTNLNKKRVGLKHHGTIPSNLDIEISRANVTDFFNQNTPIFFDIEFDSISLVSLITYSGVRGYMEKANDALSKNDFMDSIQNSQIAFKELLIEHKEDNSLVYRSPFEVIENFTFLNSFFMRIESNEHRIKDFIDAVGRSLKELENTVNLIGFGIDYKKYCKFRLLSPLINTWTGEDGKREYQVYNNPHDGRICDKKNALFCFHFVVDSALKLQKFDLDVWGTVNK